MPDVTSLLRRRDLLKAAAATTAARWVRPLFAKDDSATTSSSRPLPRVASINSIYRFRSHAYHIAGRFIHGYTINGLPHQPPLRLVRMFDHQQPENDLGPEVCRTHGIELCSSVAKALGGDNVFRKSGRSVPVFVDKHLSYDHRKA